MESPRLIVGLGNPGKTYEKTRHNVGFLVLEALAQKLHLEWKKRAKFKGRLAETLLFDQKVILLEPETYMNLSGESVVLAKNYYNVSSSNTLVVVDDVSIPLGQMRMRYQGSSGGHNGLKSIEEALSSQGYVRLRIGVGSPGFEDLSDYVLGRFSKEEEALLQPVAQRAIQAIELWLEKGLTRAMDFANQRPSNPSNGENNE